MLKQVDLKALESELSEAGETREASPEDPARLSLRGVVPGLTCRPSTPEALGAALAACDRAGGAVVPWGGGTQQRLGSPPERADVALFTTDLNHVVEYEPADLTVTVEAGMRLADLQAALAKNGQWLPIDPQIAPGATLGGLVATNVNGPRRIRYGGLRDLVIGTKVAGPDGKITKAGGHVVKNVTGYDLNKAHIGALGTLGVLVELSLKIAPRPEVETTWFGVFASAAAASKARDLLLRMPVPPAAVELLNQRAARAAGLSLVPGQWALLCVAAGFPEQVQRYLAEFEAAAEANAAASSQPLAERASSDAWRTYEATMVDLRWSGEALTCRAAVPLAQCGNLCDVAARLGDEPVVWSHAHGAVFWSVSGEAEDQATMVTELRRAAEAVEGGLVVENWPDSLGGVDVWGKTGGPLEIMKAVKSQFDPRGTLNPGRYVGTI